MKVTYDRYVGDKNHCEVVGSVACCACMEVAFRDDAVEFYSDYTNGYRVEVAISSCEGDYDGGIDHNYLKINFCPFCAAPVVVEERKVIRVTKTKKYVPRTEEVVEYTEQEEPKS